MSGPEFVTEQVKVVLVVREMYGLKSYGSYFRVLLAEQLHDLVYRPSILTISALDYLKLIAQN